MDTHGNRASSTLCPVRRGWLPASFSVTGRSWRTGHTCNMVYLDFSPSNSVSNTTSYNRSITTHCYHIAYTHFNTPLYKQRLTQCGDVNWFQCSRYSQILNQQGLALVLERNCLSDGPDKWPVYVLTLTVYSPGSAIQVTVPRVLGGSMILCLTRMFSYTIPYTSPPVTWLPTWNLIGRVDWSNVICISKENCEKKYLCFWDVPWHCQMVQTPTSSLCLKQVCSHLLECRYSGSFC